MRIETIAADTLPRVLDLYNRAYAGCDYHQPADVDFWTRKLARSGVFDPRYCLVARDDDVVGVLLASVDDRPGVRTSNVARVVLMAVEPTRRREGIGRAMIDALRQRAAADGLERITTGFGWMSLYPGVSEEWTAALAFFAALGFREAAGRACSMLAPLREFRLSAASRERERALAEQGILIRAYRETDLDELMDFTGRESGFGGFWPQETLGKLRRDVEAVNGYGLLDTFAPDEVLVVENRGAIVGFAVVQGTRPRGYFGPVGIAESARQGGLGTLLLERALEVLAHKGCDEVDLWTGYDSYQSNRYYPRVGFAVSQVWRRFDLDVGNG